MEGCTIHVHIYQSLIHLTGQGRIRKIIVKAQQGLVVQSLANKRINNTTCTRVGVSHSQCYTQSTMDLSIGTTQYSDCSIV